MKRCREESWRCSYCGDDGCGKGNEEEEEEEEEARGLVFLHNVQHKGRLRLLCTNCVLMNHPGLFCPICLQPFEASSIPHPPPPPVGHRLMCLKCPSIAHLSCSSSSSSFLCPPCCSSHKPPPPFRFFSFSNRRNSFLDRDNAKALVAAATIAAFSMNKAAIAARADADRLLKEALAAKKRAKQALDILAHLVAIDNQNKDATTMVNNNT